MTIFGWTVSRRRRTRTAYLAPSRRPGQRRANNREMVRGVLAVGDSFTAPGGALNAAGRRLSPYHRRSVLEWLANAPRRLRRFTVTRISSRYTEVEYEE